MCDTNGCNRGTYYPSPPMVFSTPCPMIYGNTTSSTQPLLGGDSSTWTPSTYQVMTGTGTGAADTTQDDILPTNTATIVDLGSGTCVDTSTGGMMNAYSGNAHKVPVQVARAMAVQATSRSLWQHGFRPIGGGAFHSL